MDRVVVVTGGSGAIGSAIRRRFHAQGDHCVGLDAVALEDEAGRVLPVDVADEVTVHDTFDRVKSLFGAVQVLVNSAGMTGAGTVLDEPLGRWNRILDVNLTSVFLCSREVIPDMAAAQSGKIVNIASVNARFGGSALSGPAYAASKGGMLTLTRFLAREHAKDGIQVNAIAPGPHDTPMWHALDVTLRERILDMIPSGNSPGSPDDLAAAVVFLCSPEAGYITGATLDVNGGQWMG